MMSLVASSVHHHSVPDVLSPQLSQGSKSEDQGLDSEFESEFEDDVDDEESDLATTSPSQPRGIHSKEVLIKYPDQSSYRGLVLVENGLRHGHGIFVSKNRDSYEGEWKYDKRNGCGTYSWSSGDTYTGRWKDGLMHYRGNFLWANGDKYSGDWCMGRMHGFATKEMAAGDIYTGEFKNDRATGFGCKIFRCGDRHEGQYKDDKRQGHGIYLWTKTGDFYDGNWSKGRMCGHGIKVMANGDTYDGEWLNDKAHGYGVKIFTGGDRHEGTYQHDQRHGIGMYYWHNEDKFEGSWVNGEQQGQGTYYYRNGDVFRGTWKDGKKHGEGILTSNNNRTMKETWQNGFRISREPWKYTPVRLLKTLTAEQTQSLKMKEGARIEAEIARMQSWLRIIQDLNSNNRRMHQHLSILTNQRCSRQLFSHIPSLCKKMEYTPRRKRRRTRRLSSLLSVSPIPSPTLSASSPQNTSPVSLPPALSLSSPEFSLASSSSSSSSSSSETSPFPFAQFLDDDDNNNDTSTETDNTLVAENEANTPPASKRFAGGSGSSPTPFAPSCSPPSLPLPTRLNLCKVCMDNEVNTVFIRCGHIAVCMGCSNHLDKCPICRQDIDEVIQTYFS